MEVRRCTIAELAAMPNLEAVLAEYAAEAALAELGPPCVQVETYRALEATGLFHPIGAFENGQLAGFILPIVIVLPHYGAMAATVESFFVLKAERHKGVGARLLVEAERLARELGAKALLISAPIEGILARVLDLRSKYRASNTVFVRALA